MTNIINAIAASPALTNIFVDADEATRAWIQDGTQAISLNEDGTLSLLDSDGYPSNHTLSIHHAEHLASTGNLENWDYFASAQ